MKTNDKGSDRLMHALLKEDARGGDDEQLLAAVERAIDHREDPATGTTRRGAGLVTPLSWAAVLAVSVGGLCFWIDSILPDPVAAASPPAPKAVAAKPAPASAVMRLRIEDVFSEIHQAPTRISFNYQAEGRDRTEHFEAGSTWPEPRSASGDGFPFHREQLPGGRTGLTVFLERLPGYLQQRGADPLRVNRTLLVDTNHEGNGKVRRPSRPSLPFDPVVIIREAKDLTAFHGGLTINTSMRIYFADDANVVPSRTGPGGTPSYPELVVNAPEKRFGTRSDAVRIAFAGQVGDLARDVSLARIAKRGAPGLPAGVTPLAGSGNVVAEGMIPVGIGPVRPLDLKSGASSAILSGGLPPRGREVPPPAVPSMPRGPRDHALRPVDGEHPPVDRERYGQLADQPWKTPIRTPLSTFSIDVDTASYANIRRLLRDGTTVPGDAVRIEECINYFDYDYPAPKNDGPFAVHVEMADCPWQDRHHLVKIGLKGREVDNRNRPPSNLVFLIDVSGSMRDSSKLPLLLESMKILVNELDERDSVGLVVYAGAAGTVLEPTPVAGEGRETILAALDRLQAGGSTAGADGIQAAYSLARRNFRKDGVNRVILATDGDFNVGTSSTGALVDLVKRNGETGVFLSVLGFGAGNLNDGMMEAITNDGNGNYFYIDSKREGRKVFLQDLTGTLVTIAKDVKIQVEFNPAKVAAYRLIGYANRILPPEAFNDDTVDAGDIGAGHTVTALYEIVPSGGTVPPTGTVDALKYRERQGPAVVASEEWMTVKLRYKAPDGDKSTLLELPVAREPMAWEDAPADFLFATGVALFGEKLRGSDKIGNARWELVRDLARRGSTRDPHGHRAEFRDLVELAVRHAPPEPGDAPQDGPEAVEAPPAR